MKDEARKRIAGNVIIDSNGCWIWNGNPRENGYCRTSFKRKSWYIHRLSYYAFVGEIEDGMDICHSCDVRACCNPNHLFQGTRKHNMEDAVKKNRHAQGYMLPQTKIGPEMEGEIMDLVKEGKTYKDIAKKYGVVRHTIGRIARKNGVFRHAERM